MSMAVMLGPDGWGEVADPREHLVVGDGMAGRRAVEEPPQRDPLRYRVTIFGAEALVD